MEVLKRLAVGLAVTVVGSLLILFVGYCLSAGIQRLFNLESIGYAAGLIFFTLFLGGMFLVMSFQVGCDLMPKPKKAKRRVRR